MKGLSVIVSLALLVVAQQLAWHLSRAGVLPSQKELTPSQPQPVRFSRRHAAVPFSRTDLPTLSLPRVVDEDNASGPILEL